MNRSNRIQKEKIQQFIGITGASEKAAQACLQNAGWSTEAAIDNFYTSPELPAPSGRRKAIEALFDRLKDPQQDIILVDGITQFCNELEVDPSDIVVLVISWHFKAASMGEYLRTEFVDGMEDLSCDSTAKLKRRLPSLRTELHDKHKFKEIWDFAYMFSREKGQKCVQLDTAIGMWQLLFEQLGWTLADAWCEFVQKHHRRAVSRDTWVQLLDFIRTIKPDLSNFDGDMAAWPYLIDEFVEHMRQQQQQQQS